MYLLTMYIWFYHNGLQQIGTTNKSRSNVTLDCVSSELLFLYTEKCDATCGIILGVLLYLRAFFIIMGINHREPVNKTNRGLTLYLLMHAICDRELVSNDASGVCTMQPYSAVQCPLYAPDQCNSMIALTLCTPKPEHLCVAK